MEQDKDKSPARIDTSNLSGDFSSKASQMDKDHLENPRLHSKKTEIIVELDSNQKSLSENIRGQFKEAIAKTNEEEIGYDNPKTGTWNSMHDLRLENKSPSSANDETYEP